MSFHWDCCWIPVDKSAESRGENWMRRAARTEESFDDSAMIFFSSRMSWDNRTAVWCSPRSVRKHHTSITLGGRQRHSKSCSTLFRGLEGYQTFLNPELAPCKLESISSFGRVHVCQCVPLLSNLLWGIMFVYRACLSSKSFWEDVEQRMEIADVLHGLHHCINSCWHGMKRELRFSCMYLTY